MRTLDLVVTGLTIAANLGMGVADLARAPFVVANAREVHVPTSWVPLLGALKIAGAIGLLGERPVNIAAAVGLVLFFVGALGFHVRARVFSNMAFPAAFLALAAGSLTFALAR